jgi:fucose permease
MLAMKLSSDVILLCHFIIIITFNILIIMTYELSYNLWFWISNIGISIGCSTIYPTIYAFLQQCFEIDNRKASIFLFISGFTSAVYPLIVGTLIAEKPLVLIYLNIISITLCVVFLVSIRLLILKFSRISRAIPHA